VPVDLFRKQLDTLYRLGFTTITFEDVRQFQNGHIPLPAKPIIITYDDGYLDTYDIAFPIMREFGMCASVFAIGDRTIETNVWDEADEYDRVPLMSDDQLREMHDAEFEICSHSMSHPDLSRLKGERLLEEIKRSRESLQEVLGAPVLTFAYPYGKVNKRAKDAVYEAGYRNACAVFSGPATFGKDMLEIRRIEVCSSHGVPGLVTEIASPIIIQSWLGSKYRDALSKVGIGKN